MIFTYNYRNGDLFAFSQGYYSEHGLIFLDILLTEIYVGF
jgi:hypothetical protein